MSDNVNKGAVLGIVGAIFNCVPDWTFKELAFIVWLISNFVLIFWALKQDAEPVYIFGVKMNMIVIMYIIYMGTSTFGLVSHLLTSGIIKIC